MQKISCRSEPRPQTMIFVFSLIALTACLLVTTALAKDPLGQGQDMPDLELLIPGQADQAAYLGLKQEDGKTFRLSQIKTPWLLIEVFNMYCTICQGEADRVNQLYKKISQSPLREQIAVIGIGVGNSPFEVNVFRKRYGVKFPLFDDSGFKAHKVLGEPRTPYFLLVRLGKSKLRIALANLGPFGDVSNFLADLQKAMDQK
jgi:peroxiredoxin